MAIVTITDQEKTLSLNAYVAFNIYAAHGDPDVSMFEPMQQLQILQHRWQERALSAVADRSVGVMLHGIVEEGAWELLQAIEDGDVDEQIDAIGDIMIYSCAMCTQLRLDYMTLTNAFEVANIEEPGDAFLLMVKTFGKLAHVIGKSRQKTRGYTDDGKVREHAGAQLAAIAKCLNWMCFANGWDAYALFDTTLKNVMQRDWTKNAVTGIEDVTQLELEIPVR